MASAIVALANITLGSAQASVTFGSIPATYRDLRLVISAKVVTQGAPLQIRFNGDSGSNYSTIYMYGTGSSSGSGSATTSLGYLDVLGADTTAPTVNTLDIMDYSATDKHKTAINRNSAPANGAQAMAIRWANTAAITSMVLDTGNGNYATGTSFALYGIVSA